MGHSVRYTRPETLSTIARIFVPTDEETPKQIRRLRALGYTIVDITPPLSEQKTIRIHTTSVRV